MKTPFYFFIATDDYIEKFLKESFPSSIIFEESEQILIDGLTYYYEPIEVSNLNEVNDQVQLYKLDLV